MKTDCIEFVQNVILPNEFIFDKISSTVVLLNENQYNNQGIDFSASLLKALLIIPSKKVIDFVLVKVKNWDPKTLNPASSAYGWGDRSNMDCKLFFNILLNSSDEIKKKHCSRQTKVILEIFSDLIGSLMDISDYDTDWPKVLECIELYGREYLGSEYMEKLKMSLLRINEKYLDFKRDNQWKIIVALRKILKSFFGINGEKIIDKKYDKRDNEYVYDLMLCRRTRYGYRGGYRGGNRGGFRGRGRGRGGW